MVSFTSLSFSFTDPEPTLEVFYIPASIMWSVNTSRMKDEFFPEPQKFDPLRFQGNGPAPYVFTPFGGGPRTCPGNEFAKMEMLVFLHYLLLSHDWKPVITNEGIIVETAPLPAHGLPVKLSKR
ncbi:hypothetical protein SELMODRAFT_95630 [Selaginella moellendorffii]|uniref:Uncharacterized protein n=1 Tax=Selaginella moellendorffii TaxID=88036 RepID=D8RJX0_SELML|nr:hypothetical protein SELMODRAFT_95630 [Selaginella moellendorffii]